MAKKQKTWDFRPNELKAYQKGGFQLIPLNRPDARDAKNRSIGKAPLNSGWRRISPLTFDEALQLMTEEKHNVGVRLRDTDLVIDVDPRNFQKDDDPLKRLQEDIGIDFSCTPTVVTGSGGLHIYLKKPADIAVRDSLDAYEGVEFKTLGRQVVAAGSVHPATEKPYLLDALCDPLHLAPEAPHALMEVIKRPGRMAGATAGKLCDKPEALEEALQFLDAFEFGKGNHERWLQLMLSCHHATAGEGRAEFLAWCATDPEYADRTAEVGRRWDSLHSDGARVISYKHLFGLVAKSGEAGKNWVRQIDRIPAEQDFPNYSGEEIDDLDELLASLPDGSKDVNEALEWFNRQGFCAVLENGQFRIMRQVEDTMWRFLGRSGDDEKPRMVWESSHRQDFLNYYETKKVEKEATDAKGRTKSSVVQLAPLWLGWRGRREYEGVVFDPAGRFRHMKLLNLWTDWAVQPRKGDWSLLQTLLREALCGGNQEAYEYCLNWAAYMVQNPDRPAEVAIVFRGAKGVGKGTWGRALARLCGRHSLQISNQAHFTNHFNAHLRDCLAGDTLVLTREYGSVPIGSLAGRTVTLLDGHGDWVRCPIIDHGVQQTYETTFRSGRGKHSIRVRSTANHGWVVDGSKTMTKDLHRDTIVEALAPSKTVRDADTYRRGVVHGLVYGDGSSRGKLDVGAFELNVFSHHESHEPWLYGFSRCEITYDTAISSGKGWSYRIPRAFTEGRNFKDLPAGAVETDDYLLGFIRGWFAADGCMGKDGGSYIACGTDEIDWLRQWGPVVGWRFLGASKQPSVTNLGTRNKELFLLKVEKRSIVEDDLLIAQHLYNWQKDRARRVSAKHSGWRPVSKAEGRMERVYCPSVPTTQSFALSSGIHSSNCIFLFADEAMWAGDKKAEGELKRLITEDTLAIEAKGKDVVHARNMLHVMMASNEEWVVPAGLDDERRFAVFEVLDLFRGDEAFFQKLNHQLNNGGLQALLWDLKTRDISQFHPRKGVPKTGAMAKQKIASMDYLDQWWYNCLVNRSMGKDIHPVAGEWGVTSARFMSYHIQQSVEQYLQKCGDRSRMRRSTMTTIGERFKKRVPTARHVRFMAPKELALELGEWLNRDGRTYGYDLPSVEKCRQLFESQIGEALKWDQDAEDVDFDPSFAAIDDEFDPLA